MISTVGSAGVGAAPAAVSGVEATTAAKRGAVAGVAVIERTIASAGGEAMMRLTSRSRISTRGSSSGRCEASLTWTSS